MTVLDPLRDASRIQSLLEADQPLVACLCASWCDSCAAWRHEFASLSSEYPGACFVWIDIDRHADMVAEVDLDTLPVMLIQPEENRVAYVGAIIPKPDALRLLMSRIETLSVDAVPGIYEFLTDPVFDNS